MRKVDNGKKGKKMVFIVATNVVASQPPKRGQTGMPHAHANYCGIQSDIFRINHLHSEKLNIVIHQFFLFLTTSFALSNGEENIYIFCPLALLFVNFCMTSHRFGGKTFHRNHESIKN